VETPISFGTPLRMKTHWAASQSSFVPISSMAHIGTNRVIFGVVGGIEPPDCLYLQNITGIPREPRRSTSVSRTEVLRGGSGGARGRVGCRVGGIEGQEARVFEVPSRARRGAETRETGHRQEPGHRLGADLSGKPSSHSNQKQRRTPIPVVNHTRA
jgi:hypothetical protein